MKDVSFLKPKIQVISLDPSAGNLLMAQTKLRSTTEQKYWIFFAITTTRKFLSIFESAFSSKETLTFIATKLDLEFVTVKILFTRLYWERYFFGKNVWAYSWLLIHRYCLDHDGNVGNDRADENANKAFRNFIPTDLEQYFPTRNSSFTLWNLLISFLMKSSFFLNFKNITRLEKRKY